MIRNSRVSENNYSERTYNVNLYLAIQEINRVQLFSQEINNHFLVSWKSI